MTGPGRGTSRATARSAAHPPAALWATDPAGFGQVGCVYTAQGFEYDWPASSSALTSCGETTAGSRSVGANKDPDFRNRTKVSDQTFDRLVRNVYKVLLTRGMRGVATLLD